jgi:hypothetical protein
LVRIADEYDFVYSGLQSYQEIRFCGLCSFVDDQAGYISPNAIEFLVASAA